MVDGFKTNRLSRIFHTDLWPDDVIKNKKTHKNLVLMLCNIGMYYYVWFLCVWVCHLVPQHSDSWIIMKPVLVVQDGGQQSDHIASSCVASDVIVLSLWSSLALSFTLSVLFCKPPFIHLHEFCCPGCEAKPTLSPFSLCLSAEGWWLMH